MKKHKEKSKKKKSELHVIKKYHCNVHCSTDTYTSYRHNTQRNTLKYETHTSPFAAYALANRRTSSGE
jgi:hypothetical protein